MSSYMTHKGHPAEEHEAGLDAASSPGSLHSEKQIFSSELRSRSAGG